MARAVGAACQQHQPRQLGAAHARRRALPRHAALLALRPRRREGRARRGRHHPHRLAERAVKWLATGPDV